MGVKNDEQKKSRQICHVSRAPGTGSRDQQRRVAAGWAPRQGRLAADRWSLARRSWMVRSPEIGTYIFEAAWWEARIYHDSRQLGGRPETSNQQTRKEVKLMRSQRRGKSSVSQASKRRGKSGQESSVSQASKRRESPASSRRGSQEAR